LVLTKSEAVWRHILVNADRGVVRYGSIRELATELDLAVSTVHKALRRPASMGALQVRRAGGVRVIDSARIMLLWAGHRELSRDVLATHRTPIPAPEVEGLLAGAPFVLGGFGAIVSHSEANPFASYDQVLCYGSPEDLPRGLTEDSGSTVLTVLEPDPRLAAFGRVTPFSQAFVDLFNTPGWPAERFVHGIVETIFGG
jgi:hypothetical protein